MAGIYLAFYGYKVLYYFIILLLILFNVLVLNKCSLIFYYCWMHCDLHFLQMRIEKF